MDLLFRFQAQATALTAGVCLLFLVRLWRESELFGAQQAVFCAWFVVALVGQLLAHGGGLWIAAFLAQFALAVVLVLKDQIDNIY